MIEPYSGGGAADLLASIDWGSRLTSGQVDVYFYPGGFVEEVFLYDWIAYEKRQAMLALDRIAQVATLTFRETSDPAAAEFFLALTELDDQSGTMEPPGEEAAGLGVFDPFSAGWDYDRPGRGGLEPGGSGFLLLLHEFGHGLGLAHPHDDGGTSTVWDGVRDAFGSFGRGDLNQGVYTTMSYNDGWPAGPAGIQDPTIPFGFQATMMALDIAVLQAKYGANRVHATGDDVYHLPDRNYIGTAYSCIWDAGGNDRIVYDGDMACVIDLRPASLLGKAGGGGWVSFADGVQGEFTIAHGVRIEDARGGTGDDVLRGNAGANTLAARAGSDLLLGAGGADLLSGGRHADTLYGGPGADRLWGGGGPDLLTGGGGADLLDGGRGADIFRFAPGHGSNRIADFEIGHDRISILRGADSLGDLNVANRGGDAVFGFADVTIRVAGVAAALLDEADFVFG